MWGKLFMFKVSVHRCLTGLFDVSFIYSFIYSVTALSQSELWWFSVHAGNTGCKAGK